jgi:uncharacterized protein YjbI with pentapeptide repeats
MTTFDDSESEYVALTFKNIDLSGKSIVEKEFDCCTFSECDFSEATFDRCNFVDCHFIKCNLSVVNIAYSKFSEIQFDECKVIGIDWTKSSWSRFVSEAPIKFHKCVLNDSSFFGLEMQSLQMDECKVHDVDFRDANMNEGNFSYSDFSHSLFNKTNLSGADFTEASNYDIDISNNNVKGAKFSRLEAVRLLEYLGLELVD